MQLRLPFNGSHPLTQGFGENPDWYARFGLSGHNGVDWGLPVKTPIVAVDAGEAIEVLDDPPGFGRYVKLKHTWGESLYAHLEQQLVRQGQTVGAGHLVGMSGNTGNSTGPHLHFVVQRNKGGALESVPVEFAGVGGMPITVHTGERHSAY